MIIAIKNFLAIESASVRLKDTAVILYGRNDDSPNVSNGSGKTLFLEAIYYCVYGNSLRGIPLTQLVGPWGDKMTVAIQFNSRSGDKVVIKRSRTKTKTTVSLKINGEEITAQTLDDYQAIIDELMRVNSHKSKTALYYGEYADHLLDLTSAKRAELILGLIDYDDKTHKSIHKKLGSMVEDREKRFFDSKIELGKLSSEVELEIEKAAKNVERVKTKIEIIEENLAMNKKKASSQATPSAFPEELSTDEEWTFDVEDEKTQLKSAITAVDSILNQRKKEIEKREKIIEVLRYDDYEKIFSDMKENEAKAEQIKKKVGEIKSNCKSSSQRIEEVCFAILLEHRNLCIDERKKRKEALENLEFLEKSLNQVDKNLVALRSRLKEKEKQIESIEENIESNQCYACGQEIEDEEAKSLIYEKKEKMSKELSVIIEDITQAEEDLEQLQSKVDSFEVPKEFEIDSAKIAEDIRQKFFAVESDDDSFSFIRDFLLRDLDFEQIDRKDKKFFSICKEHIKELTDESSSRYYAQAKKEFMSDYKDVLEEIETANATLEEIKRKEESVKKEIKKLSNYIDRAITYKNHLKSILDKIIEHLNTLDKLGKDLKDAEVEYKKEVKSIKGRANKKRIALESKINEIEYEKAMIVEFRRALGMYKKYRMNSFVLRLEKEINLYMAEIESDIRCAIRISEEDNGKEEIDILFTDSSKGGELLPFSVFSRGERTRIKKVFFQIFVEIFKPPFILSDESFDGLDSHGIKAISNFTLRANSSRIYIEASPQRLDVSDSYAPQFLTAHKAQGIISIVNGDCTLEE